MDEELIPFLVIAFGKDANYWREAAQRAKKHTYMLVSSPYPGAHHSRYFY
jgi:hypothetical protein